MAFFIGRLVPGVDELPALKTFPPGVLELPALLLPALKTRLFRQKTRNPEQNVVVFHSLQPQCSAILDLCYSIEGRHYLKLKVGAFVPEAGACALNDVGVALKLNVDAGGSIGDGCIEAVVAVWPKQKTTTNTYMHLNSSYRVKRRTCITRYRLSVVRRILTPKPGCGIRTARRGAASKLKHAGRGRRGL